MEPTRLSDKKLLELLVHRIEALGEGPAATIERSAYTKRFGYESKSGGWVGQVTPFTAIIDGKVPPEGAALPSLWTGTLDALAAACLEAAANLSFLCPEPRYLTWRIKPELTYHEGRFPRIYMRLAFETDPPQVDELNVPLGNAPDPAAPITLHTAPVTLDPVPLLMHMLERAKAGEIVSVCAVGLFADGSTMTAMSDPGLGALQMIGALEVGRSVIIDRHKAGWDG